MKAAIILVGTELLNGAMLDTNSLYIAEELNRIGIEIEFKLTVRDVIEEIILYGSYVRGQETSESDIDIAVILRLPDTDELHRKMIDIVVDNELDLEITLSVITIEEDNLNEWKSTLPFYKNLLKEGISLWKNARESYQSTVLKQA